MNWIDAKKEKNNHVQFAAENDEDILGNNLKRILKPLQISANFEMQDWVITHTTALRLVIAHWTVFKALCVLVRQVKKALKRFCNWTLCWWITLISSDKCLLIIKSYRINCELCVDMSHFSSIVIPFCYLHVSMQEMFPATNTTEPALIFSRCGGRTMQNKQNMNSV